MQGGNFVHYSGSFFFFFFIIIMTIFFYFKECNFEEGDEYFIPMRARSSFENLLIHGSKKKK